MTRRLKMAMILGTGMIMAASMTSADGLRAVIPPGIGVIDAAPTPATGWSVRPVNPGGAEVLEETAQPRPVYDLRPFKAAPPARASDPVAGMGCFPADAC